MQSTIAEYFVSEDGFIRLFADSAGGLSPEDEVSVLVGTESCNVTLFGAAEGRIPIRTLLLVDNSKSVHDFGLVRSLVHRIVSDHMEGEEFLIMTFDSHLTPVDGLPDGFSSDYEPILAAVDQMMQADRSIEVNNVIEEAQSRIITDGSFYRIVLITDGGDTVSAGSVTLEELEELWRERPVLLHTIGVPWDSGAAYSMNDIAALGRKFGSYHILEDEPSAQEILNTLQADAGISFIDAEIPPGAQDGSVRSVMAEITVPEGKARFSRDIRMPQNFQAEETPAPSPLPTPIPTSTPSPTPEPSVTDIPEINTHETGLTFLNITSDRTAIFCAVGLMILAISAILFLLRFKRKKEHPVRPEEPEILPDYDSTEFYSESAVSSESDSFETQLIFDRTHAPGKQTVVLSGVTNPEDVIRIPVTGNIIIGSSSRFSEAVIPGDPPVSRRHARLSLFENSIFLEDLESTNGTWLNREKLNGKALLSSGDLVRFGDSEFTVLIEEEADDEKED